MVHFTIQNNIFKEIINFDTTESKASLYWNFGHSALTWRVYMDAGFAFWDVCARTPRPSRAARWAAPYPYTWCPQSQPSRPGDSILQLIPESVRILDVRSEHGLCREHNKNLYMNVKVFNLLVDRDEVSLQICTSQMARIYPLCAHTGVIVRWS